MEMNQVGLNDIFFKKYDEHLTFSKPIVHFKNLIFGSLYIDVDGEFTGINMKTNHTVKVKFIEKVSEKDNSKVSG